MRSMFRPRLLRTLAKGGVVYERVSAVAWSLRDDCACAYAAYPPVDESLELLGRPGEIHLWRRVIEQPHGVAPVGALAIP